MSWGEVIYEVQRLMRALPGISDAPVNMPDANAATVYSLSYIGAGSSVKEGAVHMALQDVVIEVTTPRGAGLPAAIERLTPFFDSVPNLFSNNVTLGGKIQTYERIENEGILQGELSGIPVVFIRFRLRNCKRRPTIT